MEQTSKAHTDVKKQAEGMLQNLLEVHPLWVLDKTIVKPHLLGLEFLQMFNE